MELCTSPPPGSTVICVGELGPVIPCTFPPAPGWSGGGHRIKAPLEYARAPDKTLVYGGLRIRDGQEIPVRWPKARPAWSGRHAARQPPDRRLLPHPTCCSA